MHLKQDKWQRHGILLTPVSDYSGTQGLNPRLTASLKPFEHAVFVLQNRTGHALHGFSAVWPWTDSSTGKARQSHLVNFLFEGPSPNGADLFIGPFGVVSHAARDPGPLVTQQKTLPQPGESVSIDVQFVLLDDGTAIGTGAAGIVDRARGQIRAYKDFAQDLAAIDTVEGAKAYLQGKMTNRQRASQPDSPLSPPPIGSGAWAYQTHQSGLATHALHWLDQGKDLSWVKATAAAQAARMPDYNITVKN